MDIWKDTHKTMKYNPNPWLNFIDCLTHWPARRRYFTSIFWNSFKEVISWLYPYQIGRRRELRNPIDDKSTLVEVMAWCYQANSRYLSHFWLRSRFPYGITKQQWFNFTAIKVRAMRCQHDTPYTICNAIISSCPTPNTSYIKVCDVIVYPYPNPT